MFLFILTRQAPCLLPVLMPMQQIYCRSMVEPLSKDHASVVDPSNLSVLEKNGRQGEKRYQTELMAKKQGGKR